MGEQVLLTCLKLSAALVILQLIACATSESAKTSEQSVSRNDCADMAEELPPPFPRSQKNLMRLQPLLNKLKEMRPVIWKKIQQIILLPAQLRTPKVIKDMWNNYNCLGGGKNQPPPSSKPVGLKQVDQPQASNDKKSVQVQETSTTPSVGKKEEQTHQQEAPPQQQQAPAVVNHNSQAARPVDATVPTPKPYGWWNRPASDAYNFSPSPVTPPETLYGYPLYDFDYEKERERTLARLKTLDYAAFFKWLFEEDEKRTNDFGAFLKRLLGEK